MKAKYIYVIASLLIGLISIFLSITWYDYKLALIIFIAILGNNLDQHAKNL